MGASDEQQARMRQPGMGQQEQQGQQAGTDAVRIDCDDCAVRGFGCRDCVVSVLLGVPQTLQPDERAALDVLANAGLAPRLRLVPGGRGDGCGAA